MKFKRTLLALGKRSPAMGRLRPEDGRKPISIVSIVNGKHIREPVITLPVYFSSFAINLLALALPLSIMQVYDRVIPNHSVGTLAILFLSLALALVIEFVLKILRSTFLCWQAKCFVRDTENEAVARILRTADKDFERQPAAVHINRYAAVGALGEYLSGPSRLVSIDLPFVVIGLAVMSTVGGIIVLVPVGLFLIFATFAILRSRKLRKVLHQSSTYDNRKYDFIAEVLGGIQAVKLMAMEPQMQRRLERLQQAVAESTMASILTGQAEQTSALLYGSISQLVVVAIGASRVIDDHMSMGALACCTMFSGQILQPLLGAISQWMEKESVYHRRQEIGELLDLRASEVARLDHYNVAGDVHFENVTFSHDPSLVPPLLSMGFSITAGTIIGIKGGDGSGRTTILNLLNGEVKPVSGRVLVDNISTVDPKFIEVRQRIITLGADPVIFRGTIMENLTLFRPERREFARKMTQFLGLDATVNLLPDGFETRLGEALSDDLPISIAQQLNVVRALTSDPRILILDEVNTVLDVAAERGLIRAIENLRGHLTIVVVSHRPSVLAIADRILTVQNGCVDWDVAASVKTASARSCS